MARWVAIHIRDCAIDHAHGAVTPLRFDAAPISRQPPGQVCGAQLMLAAGDFGIEFVHLAGA